MEPYEGRTAASVRTEVRYILDRYGSHPAFLRMRFKRGTVGECQDGLPRQPSWPRHSPASPRRFSLFCATSTARVLRLRLVPDRCRRVEAASPAGWRHQRARHLPRWPVCGPRRLRRPRQPTGRGAWGAAAPHTVSYRLPPLPPPAAGSHAPPSVRALCTRLALMGCTRTLPATGSRRGRP